jgi:hypothetical protein
LQSIYTVAILEVWCGTDFVQRPAIANYRV